VIDEVVVVVAAAAAAAAAPLPQLSGLGPHTLLACGCTTNALGPSKGVARASSLAVPQGAERPAPAGALAGQGHPLPAAPGRSG